MKLVAFAVGTRHRTGVVGAAAGILRDATELLPAGAGVLAVIERWAELGPGARAADEDKVGPPEVGTDTHGNATGEILSGTGHRTALQGPPARSPTTCSRSSDHRFV
jgi:hypothetical protein